MNKATTASWTTARTAAVASPDRAAHTDNKVKITGNVRPHVEMPNRAAALCHSTALSQSSPRSRSCSAASWVA